MSQIIWWIIISITALVVDVLTSSFFFAGFTVGGIAAIIMQALGYGFMGQVIVFCIVSAGAIAVEYVWFRKKLKQTIPKTLKMEEEYIGKTMIAEDDIIDRGRMKVEGIYWTVENSGEKIQKGEEVKIVGIREIN
jgi:membrane protein implicated in regulation of membrane protease activity